MSLFNKSLSFNMSNSIFSGRHFNKANNITMYKMMTERGVTVDHTTIYRWIYTYSPELEKRISKYKSFTYHSWRLDETYIKVKDKWKYLYRAIDSEGVTLDFMLSHKRDANSAKRFLKKILSNYKYDAPRSINTDKNSAYPIAISELKTSNHLPQTL